MLPLTYFLYIRESKILHYFDCLIHENNILKQWKVGNGFVDLRS